MKIEVEWKEIETCPIRKAVLVATKNGTECFVFVKEKDGKFRKCFENITLDINPTHWMDIPQMHNAEMRGASQLHGEASLSIDVLGADAPERN